VQHRVHRHLGDENAVLFVQVRGPEHHSPQQLDAYLKDCKEQPVESIGTFRRALRVGRWPRPLRRLYWWYGLNVSGYKRARNLGTFGVSVYSGLGAEALHPLSPLTTTLTYGVIAEDGTVDVRLIYDHRVLDGATVARALGELERVLNHQVLASVPGAPRKAAAPPQSTPARSASKGSPC
jgi:hypothetical protein